MNNKATSNKQISINMVANIVSYSANLIVAFILTPFLIEKVGKETYSFYPMANTIVNYMAILMNAMNSIASRFVTVSIVQEDKKEANKYFASAFASNIIMSGIIVIPMIIIDVFVDKFMNVPINSLAAVRTLFVLLFSATLVNITASVFGVATFAKNRIDLRSLRELVVAVAKLVLYFGLYWLLPPSIAYVGIVIFSVGILNLLIQFFYTHKLLPEIKISTKYFSIQHIKELFASSCWTAINSFGNQLLVGMSMIMANMFYGAAASGVYSIVNTVPQFLSGVISMIVGVFYPVITYSYAKNNEKELKENIIMSQKFVGVFGCSVATVFAAVSPEFFMLWTPGENAAELAILTRIIIIPYYFIACMWTLTNLNIIMNKVKVPALFTLGIGCLNILISYLLYRLRIGGLISLPIVSTVLQLVWIGLFIPQYVNKNLSLKWSTFYAPLARAIPCGILLFFIITWVKSFFSVNGSWVRFILFGGGTGTITLIWYSVIMFGPKKIFGLAYRRQIPRKKFKKF